MRRARRRRTAGVVLAHEYMRDILDDLDDDEEDEDEARPRKTAMPTDEELLCDLLSALDIKVDHSGGKDSFRRALYEAAMSKIKELNHNDAAGNSAPSNRRMDSNEITSRLAVDRQPMYMSLAAIAALNPDAQRIALSLCDQHQRLVKEKVQSDSNAAKQHEAKFAAARAKRQVRINKLLTAAPRMRGQLDLALHQPSAAFSMDSNGNVHDGADGILSTLEKALVS